MKKLLKGLLAVVVVVVALVAALAAHPLWVGPLVKAVAEKVGPRYTGTPIALKSCDVNLYSGHVELIGFDLANPAGCPEVTAAGVGSLKVDLDTLSALSDVINIRSIELSGIFASYVKGASGKYNFTEIADNAKAAGGSAEKPAEPPPEAAKKDEASAGKKVVIERLTVGDVRVAAFGMKLHLLPGTIVLTDLGKKSNGVTAREACEQMWDQVLKSSGAAGQQFVAAWELSEKLGKQGLDLGKQGVELGKKGLDAGTEGVGKILDSAKKLDVEGAKDALKNTGDRLKDVGGGMKDVGKDVGNGIKDVGKSLKGLFGN